nr:MAG: hypothetical protein [Microvirus sp.]
MLTLQRFNYDTFGTYGALIYNSKPLCYTLELPWKNNAKQISCIPPDIYQCHKTLSVKHGSCIRLNHVINRDGILIHTGNNLTDTQGCILVGLDVQSTGLIYSKLALERLMYYLPDTFNLKIKE